MRKFSIFYKDEQVLVHAKRTNVAEIPFGSMIETESGEFQIQLPLYPNVTFFVKEEKPAV
jgi:hypothetical protein